MKLTTTDIAMLLWCHCGQGSRHPQTDVSSEIRSSFKRLATADLITKSNATGLFETTDKGKAIVTNIPENKLSEIWIQ